MTGIADLYLYLKRPYSRDRRQRLLAHFDPHHGSGRNNNSVVQRFVVLSWKRTGSNLLCGMLHLHPEICMHNELFNPIDIFTYYPGAMKVPIDDDNDSTTTTMTASWSVLTRDLFPVRFLEYIWNPDTVNKLILQEGGSVATTASTKAIGFKSFPEHWRDAVHNEHIWGEHILRDLRVKKIILHRRDELAVYVSMQRADQTGRYLTHKYPEDLKFTIDPAEFQAFLNNYRHTFQEKYQSPMAEYDSFWITYEELIDDEKRRIKLPELYRWLGVDATVPLRTLKETIRQSDPEEDLSNVIENYDELEFCFRHSDVSHFQEKRLGRTIQEQSTAKDDSGIQKDDTNDHDSLQTWTILLPICSRSSFTSSQPHLVHNNNENNVQEFPANRFIDLARSSQHNNTNGGNNNSLDPVVCWSMLQEFAESLSATCSPEQLQLTECIVGIDVDDELFQSSRQRIVELLPCSKVIFVDIQPQMYGHVCKIWSHLGSKANHNFIVLLGDDVKLLGKNWQAAVVKQFLEISKETSLPLGAACVALNDLAFPGFPTFPVLHRWHLNQFGSLLPRQFANQGGDPYLYELYSRFNAASFCAVATMKNGIGGDGDARYQKHNINWRGQILNMNLRKLKSALLPQEANGIVLDVVVPSYRTNNNDILTRITSLRSSIRMYVKFWIVIDNPREDHVVAVQRLADELNETQLNVDHGNYFVNVIHYSENRGASYARNTGFNYSTADWILFLDDDVVPDKHILDAYAGAIRRYPYAKVFVGKTELPEPTNTWTQMLKACNVGYFYNIAERMTHPSWGVTANLMVRGSRFNSTIQFKDIYPKTGGGEDIDFVYQYKEWYSSLGRLVTVGVPEAKAKHPWWNGGGTCYQQITGWAWGDSLCIMEWPKKTFLSCPNWIEHIAFIVTPMALYSAKPGVGLVAGATIAVVEHVIKAINYFPDSSSVVDEFQEKSDATTGTSSKGQSPMTVFLWKAWVALGAGSVLSSQEVTRVVAAVRRMSFYSVCRRVDWFDGQKERIRLDIQLSSLLYFGLNIGIAWASFSLLGNNSHRHDYKTNRVH
mmetsp:Transcript_15623/g.34141  ORF Transcript_15623/g.34141 Transcript_15623/m.34141 type:complete len:1056 (-) Transcript_15623:63-3230(-)|eukprot:CAMPEP_0168847494 /NCGR_PEP_ID=MMETSP0727-20121128/10348_1 /TAXON_ID=265536 /ORGANISM="Amphiprora sp., Strain CCMP467" /LENGTH=1055 /DNA_ID=CAMNT_0008901303 /DNA_START=19 /DNA_END=3186 /DNA_ORIENTATION=-